MKAPQEEDTSESQAGSSQSSGLSAGSSQSSGLSTGSLEGMVEILVARRNLEHLGIGIEEVEKAREQFVLVEDHLREDSLQIIDDCMEKSKRPNNVIEFQLTNIHSDKKEYEFHPILKQLCLRKNVHPCTTKHKGSVNKVNRLKTVLTGIRKRVYLRRSVSLREVYYIHPKLYADQKHSQELSNDDVTDISTMTGLTIQSLNIFTSPTGTVKGPLLLFVGNKILADCRMGGIAGCRIPAEVHNVTQIRSRGKVRYILLVEKEDVFEELAADNYPERNNCLLFSGKGQPSTNSRLMLRMLRDTLGVPVYAVFDGNYGGADIYCTCKMGSENRAYDSLLLTVPDLVWLGVFPHEVKKEHRKAMSDGEKKKLKSLMQKSYMTEFPEIRDNLRNMLMLEEVCDMEMIRLDGNLSDYIETKVKSFAIPEP